jgi:hypothetical protein
LRVQRFCRRAGLGVGHLEQARAAFDSAVDVLLKLYGARSSRASASTSIDWWSGSAREVTALAQGDGFVERNMRRRPSTICSRSTFDRPRHVRAGQRRGDGPSADASRHRHPAQQQGPVDIELFQSGCTTGLTKGCAAARYSR